MRNGILILHHISIGVFFGSLVAALVCKVLAERKGERDAIKYSIASLIALDRFVTAPSAIGVTLTGIALIAVLGPDVLWMLWLQLLLLLWVAAAAAAHFLLVPELQALGRLTAEGQVEDYLSRAQRWNKWAALMLLVPILSYGLAIVKPNYE